MTATHPPRSQEVPAPPQPPRRRLRSRAVALGLVVLVALAAAVSLWTSADDGADGSADGGTTVTTADAPTTAPPTVTSAPPTTVAPSMSEAGVLWPFPGTTTRFDTPEEAARSFATEFLRFEAPVVEPFQQGDARSGEVPIRPAAEGPVTMVLVRQVGPGEDWSVLGATAANLVVSSPRAGEEIASPVTVTGRARSPEGAMGIEVRQDGELGAIGAGSVAGGDDLRDFSATVAFETAGAPYGALVLFTTSPDDGRVWEAAALRVALRSTDTDAVACGTYRPLRPKPAAGEMEVKAYFNCDLADDPIAPFPVYRIVPESPRVLESTLEVLLAGPDTAERAAGVDSWFSSETAALLRSVTIVDGHAVIDFGDLPAVIPNASTSAGSALLLSQLDATVFQFRSVETVEYRLDGNCEAFNEWLQYGGCDPRTRGISTD